MLRLVGGRPPADRPIPRSDQPSVKLLAFLPLLGTLRRSWSCFDRLPPYLVTGVAGSGLVHLAALAVVALTFGAHPPLRFHPPAPGTASIKLVASMEAAPATVEDGPMVEILSEPCPVEVPPREAAATPIDGSMETLPCDRSRRRASCQPACWLRFRCAISRSRCGGRPPRNGDGSRHGTDA